MRLSRNDAKRDDVAIFKSLVKALTGNEPRLVHTLTIPDYLPPTTNKLFRGKMKDRIRLGKECRQMVATYAFKQCIPRAIGKRRVTLTLTIAPRRKFVDVDAPFKGILDSLKHAGLIIDDTSQFCELAPLVQVRGEKRKTEITLEEME